MTAEKTKKKHPALKLTAVILVIALLAGAVYSHFGGFGTGKCADQPAFLNSAKPIEQIVIPESTEIIALGEATHGNAEFQQLKLEVFRIMAEQYGVRAFCLEGDYGGCEAANRYIHGGAGTAEGAAAAIGFAIYRTKEMADLLSWMRSYNETAAEGEDLWFCGFDMQRISYNYEYLLEAANHAGLDTRDLKAIWNDAAREYVANLDRGKKQHVLETVRNQLAETNEKGARFAEILLQNDQLSDADSSTAPGMRDRMMADNILWIRDQEARRGNQRIFVSAHNGHVISFGSYGPQEKVMGNLLSDKLGGDHYYVIGTDFFRASVNLPRADHGRMTHTFYSYDPLAKAAKECGYEQCWLDFAAIPMDSPLYDTAYGYCWMGSVGELYSVLMNFLPMSYRIWRCPAKSYDSMIFVSDAHPTVITEEKNPAE